MSLCIKAIVSPFDKCELRVLYRASHASVEAPQRSHHRRCANREALLERVKLCACALTTLLKMEWEPCAFLDDRETIAATPSLIEMAREMVAGDYCFTEECDC